MRIHAVAIPNGFMTSARNVGAYINKMKAEGYAPGFPDLMVFAGAKVIFIEMKRASGRPSDVSEKQAQWIEILKAHGHPAKVCFGAVEAIEFINEVK